MEFNFLGLVSLAVVAVIGIALVGCAVFGVVMLIRSLIKAQKEKKKESFRFIILIPIFIFIAAVAWILNMGWIRFIFTFLCVPIIHSLLWAFVSMKSAEKMEMISKTKVLFILSYVTYLVPYLLFPDGGDEGAMYFFFGLIRSDSNILMEVATFAASICFMANIAILIIEIGDLIKIRRLEKNQG